MANGPADTPGGAHMSALLKLCKQTGLIMSVLFALVGTIFLLAPEAVMSFFNSLSRALAMAESPSQGVGLYFALAVAYMYLVALLAYHVYRRPGERVFLWLLANGKGASAIISLFAYFVYAPFLILMTNFVVDGAIAVGLVLLSRKLRNEMS